MTKKTTRKPFKIAGESIPAGTAKTLHIPLSLLPNCTSVSLSVRVIHSAMPGKTLFISAGIHGDELNGIDVIRRVLKSPLLKNLRGTLVAIPIVNLFGVVMQSRYLPDRRDLNRSFPGSKTGSEAAQLAHTFLEDVVKKCTHGIDLHTGSNNRINLPQLRCDLQSKEAVEMAHAFAPPVILKAKLREGSLREASERLGLPTLTYEGGEALRFNEFAIRAAEIGIFRVMKFLDMIDLKTEDVEPSVVSPASRWLRAPITGIFHSSCDLGEKIFQGAAVGKVYDPLGEKGTDVISTINGIVVGKTQAPVVYKGDALLNIAWVPDPTQAEEVIEKIEEEELKPSFFDPSSY